MRIDSTLSEQDLYARLGVSPTATEGRIRTAYRRLAREAHPDHHADDAEAVMRMAQINLAATVLLDVRLRRLYDRRRAEPRGSAPEATRDDPGVWDAFRPRPGDAEWCAPARPAEEPPDDDMALLLASLRPWPSEQFGALERFAATRSVPWHTGFMAACVVASVLLVSWARPTSLFDDRSTSERSGVAAAR